MLDLVTAMDRLIENYQITNTIHTTHTLSTHWPLFDIIIVVVDETLLIDLLSVCGFHCYQISHWHYK